MIARELALKRLANTDNGDPSNEASPAWRTLFANHHA
jgi:hypothetical protein